MQDFKIRAYNYLYLSDAQRTLSSFVDFGVNSLGVPLTKLWEDFLDSPFSAKFCRGDPFTISGKSGIEIVLDLYDIQNNDFQIKVSENRSEEYWLGYYLAYYQWATGLSFNKLNRYISIEELISMYHPYHEMDVTSFVDRVNEIYNSRKKYTNLELYRKSAKWSRPQLAEFSGVPTRIIEQYEQRRKDINKANISYVVALARALHVNPEDLLEIK